MRAKKRTEVYWRDGRLQPVTNNRPSGFGPWPTMPHFLSRELVAKITGETGYIEIEEGPSATTDRVENAFLLHRGIEPELISHQVWSRVPTDLLSTIGSRVRDAEQAVSNQWGQFSNEEATTGAFFSRLNDSFRSNDWRVNVSFVEFSKQVKEPQTGADVAVVVDALTADGQRSFKTMWFQAKTATSIPADPYYLPRLTKQIPLARQYCEASYGLIYTPQGIFVIGINDLDSLPFHEALSQCIQCRFGDTSVTALKNSLNRKKLLQVILTEGGQQPLRSQNTPRRR